MLSQTIVVFACAFSMHFPASHGTCKHEVKKSCMEHLQDELSRNAPSEFNKTCRLLEHAISCVKRYARDCITDPGQRAKFYETAHVDSIMDSWQATCSKDSPVRRLYEVQDSCLKSIWSENTDCKLQLFKNIGKSALQLPEKDAKTCCAINQFVDCMTTWANSTCGPEKTKKLTEAHNIILMECNNQHKNMTSNCQMTPSKENKNCGIDITTPCTQGFPQILDNSTTSILPQDLNKHCRMLNKAMQCVKGNLEICDGNKASQVENISVVLTSALANLTTAMCVQDSSGKTEYEQYRVCLTSLDESLKKCIDPYLMRSNDRRIEVQCCAIKKMVDCLVTKAGENCGVEASTYIMNSVTVLLGPDFRAWSVCNTKIMLAKECHQPSAGCSNIISKAVTIALVAILALH